VRRVTAPELMDEPELDEEELGRSLCDLRAVNRWLGGRRTALRRVRELLADAPPGRYRILDVATGSGDIPLAIAEHNWGGGREVEVTATDLHPQTLARGRERAGGHPRVRVERADALDLPYEDDAFDISLCSTALHHFEEQDAVQILREMARVSTLGIVVNDLRRSPLGLLGAHLLAATVWRRSRFTRHDGPVSVRAAFTPAEVLRLAERAGILEARARREPVFRLSLTIRHNEPG